MSEMKKHCVALASDVWPVVGGSWRGPSMKAVTGTLAAALAIGVTAE
jgi:hypothetical protein